MARHKHRPSGRTTPKGTRPPERSRHPDRGAPPLVADAAACLRERSPFNLLMMASGLVEVATPRPLDDWPGARKNRPDGPSAFLSFAETDFPAMGALALAVAALLPDELLASRIRKAVDPVVLLQGPAWLGPIGSIEITGTAVQTDPLGDGDNVLVSWQWPDGSAGTAVIYIDHNMGTLVKDAFVIPEDGERVAAKYASFGEQHLSLVAIDPADARARVVEAIEQGDHTVPPMENDTWPTCRPVVEWLMRHLPTGGTGYVRPEWSQRQRERLLDEFVASPFAKVPGVSAKTVRYLADPLVWFGCDYGPGDPLRWSAVTVEIVLADWYPRKVLGLSAADERHVPDVLAAFVRYAHDAKGIPADLTADTLEAVTRWRLAFLDAIRRPGRTREANAARLASIAAGFDPDDPDGDEDDDGDEFGDWDDLDHETFMALTTAELEATVVELVGGRAAYDALDDAPLGDRPFDWTAVPAELHAPTAETLEQLDRWAGELFDDEVRTIARAVLAGVVAADRGVFNRSARTDALAAGILSFLHSRLTNRFSVRERRGLPWKVHTQKELAAATGVSASSISSRTRTIANVVERADIDWPSILHSTQRAEVLRTKSIIADWRDIHPTSPGP